MGGKKRAEHDQNTPANQYSLQGLELVVLGDMNVKDEDKKRKIRSKSLMHKVNV